MMMIRLCDKINDLKHILILFNIQMVLCNTLMDLSENLGILNVDIQFEVIHRVITAGYIR